MKIYRAVVFNNDDPEKIGRVQLLIHGVHEQMTKDSDLTNLPWADVMQGCGFAPIGGTGLSSVMRKGTWVYCFFEDDNEQRPIVMGVCTGITEDRKDVFKDWFENYPSKERTGSSDFGQTCIGKDRCISKYLKDNGADEKLDSSRYLSSHVLETPCGHLIELDDTKGDEKICITHSQGKTQIKIDNAGNIVVIAAGNQGITYKVQKDVRYEIDGDMSIKVKGKIGIETEQDFNLTVKGRKSEEVHKDSGVHVKGDSNIVVDGYCYDKCGKSRIQETSDFIDEFYTNKMSKGEGTMINSTNVFNVSAKSSTFMGSEFGCASESFWTSGYSVMRNCSCTEIKCGDIRGNKVSSDPGLGSLADYISSKLADSQDTLKSSLDYGSQMQSAQILEEEEEMEIGDGEEGTGFSRFKAKAAERNKKDDCQCIPKFAGFPEFRKPNFDKIADHYKKMWDNIHLIPDLAPIGKAIDQIKNFIKGMSMPDVSIDALKNGLMKVASAGILKLCGAVMGIVNGVMSTIQGIMDTITNAIENALMIDFSLDLRNLFKDMIPDPIIPDLSNLLPDFSVPNCQCVGPCICTDYLGMSEQYPDKKPKEENTELPKKD